MADEVISLERLSDYNNNMMHDANILKRSTAYAVDDKINKGLIYLKCTQAGTTASTALSLSGVSVGDTLTDGTVKWEVISITGVPEGGGTSSGIEIWATGKVYNVDNMVLYDNTIYKCIVQHTSSTFSSDIANWEQIYADIAEWKTNTFYPQGYLVIESNTLYKCVTEHTSSTDFVLDETKWEVIGNNGGGGGGASSYKQVTKYDVTAPLEENIPISLTTDFCLPPVEVLKFQSGTQDVVTNIFDFDAGDGSAFIVDGVSGDKSPLIEFNGKVQLETSHMINFGEPEDIGDYEICESETINVNDYKSIEGLV